MLLRSEQLKIARLAASLTATSIAETLKLPLHEVCEELTRLRLTASDEWREAIAELRADGYSDERIAACFGRLP